MLSFTAIARRLLVGFGLLLILLGAASAVALAGMGRLRASIHEVRELEDGMRSLLLLSTAVRDQYAHQAHMILLGDDSHMDMYVTSTAWVQDLVDKMMTRLSEDESREMLGRIEEAASRIDEIFRSEILPAVLAGDRARAEAVHDEALIVVLEAQALSDSLSRKMMASIAGYEAAAAHAHRRSFRNALFLLLSAAAFAAGVGLWIVRSVARPVALLHEGTARLAEGDLGARVEVDSKDEFGRLAERFNEMAESLAVHQAERARSERLAGVGRLAAGVAHEINNPLAVIRGYAGLMRGRLDESVPSHAEIGADLAIVEEEVERCKAIIDDLLHMARPLSASLEPVDLAELAEQAAERLAASTEQAAERLAASTEQEGAHVVVRGNAVAAGSSRALHQVLVNLIKNGMEAAGPSGTVTVEILEKDEVYVVVSDDGPGLGPEAIERLFEPFHTMKEKGTGLGLAVSRAIVEAHGGVLEGESRDEGGARFTVRLPLFANSDGPLDGLGTSMGFGAPPSDEVDGEETPAGSAREGLS